MGLDWDVPAFSTLSRRQKTLAVNIPHGGSYPSAHAPDGACRSDLEAQHQPADEGRQDFTPLCFGGCVWTGQIRSGAWTSLSQALSNLSRSPARLPMRRGLLSLVAIMEWHIRMVLTWRISNIEPWSATGSRTMARGADCLVSRR